MQRLIFTLALGIGISAGTPSADERLQISWTNNLLTVRSPKLPGSKVEIWYPEAFCRKGSTDRDWSETVLPQKTVILSNSPTSLPGTSTRRTEIIDSTLGFETTIRSNVIVDHAVSAGSDSVLFEWLIRNKGDSAVDLEWFQPACIRVEKFTGCNQSNYTAKSFIFTERGLTMLDESDRRPETEARYHGGQVYVPKGINTNDINPRPLCRDQPTNGLIGCFSADGKSLLAVGSDSTHELFEGVYVCLHSDPHVGGLKPHETKTIHSKIYFMTNDIPALLKRYQADFPKSATKSPAGF
jgi:hypothetical protein